MSLMLLKAKVYLNIKINFQLPFCQHYSTYCQDYLDHIAMQDYLYHKLSI